jgi:hypothetical protein
MRSRATDDSGGAVCQRLEEGDGQERPALPDAHVFSAGMPATRRPRLINATAVGR